MSGKIAAITGLVLSTVLATGCQNTGPNMGQAPLGAGMYGPHVAARQPHQGDPFLNMDTSQGNAMNSGRVHVVGMQQPSVQATSNMSPTVIQTAHQQPAMPAGYQPSAMQAGYQQPAGPFAPATTMPVSNTGWQTSQPPASTKPY